MRLLGHQKCQFILEEERKDVGDGLVSVVQMFVSDAVAPTTISRGLSKSSCTRCAFKPLSSFWNLTKFMFRA